MDALTKSTQEEIAALEEAGMIRVTLKQYAADILPMGFRLDRTMDCKGVGRCLSTGRSFKSLTSSARQITTGKGFANVDADRNAPGWRAFMEYRKGHFAVVRGHIFDV